MAKLTSIFPIAFEGYGGNTATSDDNQRMKEIGKLINNNPFRKGDRVKFSETAKKHLGLSKINLNIKGIVASEPGNTNTCVSILRDGYKCAEYFHHTFLEKCDD